MLTVRLFVFNPSCYLCNYIEQKIGNLSFRGVPDEESLWISVDNPAERCFAALNMTDDLCSYVLNLLVVT